MIEIKLQFTNDNARLTQYYLRKKYIFPEKTKLKKLCEIAIKKAVLSELEIDADFAMKHLNEVE